jgi:hypothetical protein
MEDKRTRFSFSLTDILFVLAVIGAGECVLVQFASNNSSEMPPVQAFAIVTAISSVIGLLSVQFIKTAKLQGLKRVCWFMPPFVTVMLLSGQIAQSFCRSSMARNETDAAQTLRSYHAAQKTYFLKDWDGDGVLEYAAKLGDLYESVPGTANVALISADFAAADSTLPKPKPFKGYVFKTLPSKRINSITNSYSVNGNQTLGFSMLAFPAQFDKTGRNTFIIIDSGSVIQQDMGELTPAVIKVIESFWINDPLWIPYDD